jgi:hypothetical protein
LPKSERRSRYLDGCPNSKIAVWRGQDALHEIGKTEVDLDLHEIATHEDEESFRFHGSPTILINGRDPFADAAPRLAFLVVYTGPSGVSQECITRDDARPSLLCLQVGIRHHTPRERPLYLGYAPPQTA